ncbi:hypothetical protein GCK32_021039, partial [Trichostrongylus colubriformis]
FLSTQVVTTHMVDVVPSTERDSFWSERATVTVSKLSNV